MKELNKKLKGLENPFLFSKYRGKTLDNSKWVYGDLVHYSEAVSFIYTDFVNGEIYDVHTKTVGQYIKRKDKNGEEIYDGDIIRLYLCKDDKGCVWFTHNNDYREWLAVVKDGEIKITKYVGKSTITSLEEAEKREVIGNIYENPELLTN